MAMPMAGTLVLTRPRQQAGEWIERLGAEGVMARSLPLIDVAPTDGNDAARAWAALPDAALAVFVSPNAVEHFFVHRPAGASWPAGALAACVGPGSARALREAGVPVDAIVQPPADSPSLDSEHLWPQLASLDWHGRQVLLLRGNGGREWLADRLRERGAMATPFSVYRRGPPRFDAQEQALFDAILAAPRDYVWLFSSAEGVDHLGDLAPAVTDWSQSACVCTHERIAAAARRLGFAAVASARPDAAAVAQAFRALRKGDLQSFSP